MGKIYLLLVMILLNIVQPGNAETLLIRHVPPESAEDSRHLYYLDLLRLALQKTEDTDGPFIFDAHAVAMNQGRAIKNLIENKKIDLVWAMSNREREKTLRAIRIPLLKGLLGHRVFIIRKKDAKRFAKINTFEQLQQLTAGQGTDWPDTEILKSSGIKVITSINYQGLFRMLERKRFDYFPRGLNEPWQEVKMHKDKNLIVEQTLLLQYPAPIYFFVNRKNIKLAERIERGLRLAIKDGSFNDLFLNHSANKDIFKLSQLNKRRIFRLSNPLLTEETPLNEKELWYQAVNFQE